MFDLSQTSLNLAKSIENVNDPECKLYLKTRQMADRKLTLLDLKQSKVAAPTGPLTSNTDELWPIDVR